MNIMWFFLLFFPQIVISFIAYDCNHQNSNITTISAKDVETCPELEPLDMVIQEEEVQVVQNKEWTDIHVFHCLIKVTKVISHCGMHSHTSSIEGGLQSYILQITQDECIQVTEDHYIDIQGKRISDLVANSTISTSFTDVGTLDSSGKCKGSDIITPTRTLYNVVSQVSYEISLKDYISVMTTLDNQIHFNDGTTCVLTSKSCYHTTLGITAWRNYDMQQCSPTSVDVIYQGPAMVSYTKTDLVHPVFVAVRHATSLFALQIRSTSFVCHQSSYVTDHKRINVIKKASFGFFFIPKKVSARNLDLSMYMNSKISFVYDHLETQINKLYHELQHKDCELERMSLKNKLALLTVEPIHYGHLVTDEKGFYGVVAGEVIHIMSCQAVDVSIRRTEFCYNHLPVIYNNESTFMEPIGHILTQSSLEVPCSVLTPNIFDLGDKWVAMTPTLHIVPKPKVISPSVYKTDWKFDAVSSLVSSGIYDEQALDSMRTFMSFPMIRTDATNFMASKISGQTTYQNSGYSGYNMLSSSDLKKMSKSVIESLFGWMASFGAYAGALWGILMLYQLAKKVFSTMINGWSLYHAFGLGFHMIAMLATSCTHYVFVRRDRHTDDTQESDQTDTLHNVVGTNIHSSSSVTETGQNDEGVRKGPYSEVQRFLSHGNHPKM